MSKPVVVLGSGGHAQVLLGVLKRLGVQVRGVTDPDKTVGSLCFGCKVIGNDDKVLECPTDQIELVNGIGSLPGDAGVRERLFRTFSDHGFHFKVVVDSNAMVLPETYLAEGCQVMAGAIIQFGAQIAENCIVNSGAIVEHDCRIGRHVHIAPGATLSGGVKLDDRVHVGTGAVLIQNVEVGENSVIGAGAVVTENVPANSIVYPARSIIKNRRIS